MTLVVAHQKGGVIALVSDTGVIEHHVALGPDRQVPKICVINPDLAIGFAGDPDLANQYLRCLARERDQSYRSSIDFLLQSHNNSQGQVDFLACYNKPIAKIVPIRGGHVRPPAKVTWIGDHAAFNAFQHYRHSKDTKAGVTQFEKPLLITNRESELGPGNVTFQMLGALRHVCLDPKINTVFGHLVAVNNVEGAFQYRPFTFVLEEQPRSLLVPRTSAARIAPELDELRSYMASCFVTVPTSAVQGLAYHFAHPKLTYLYWGNAGEPICQSLILKGKNAEEFMQIANSELGTQEWTGMLASRTGPPHNYGLDIHRWRESVAKPRNSRTRDDV